MIKKSQDFIDDLTPEEIEGMKSYSDQQVVNKIQPEETQIAQNKMANVPRSWILTDTGSLLEYNKYHMDVMDESLKHIKNKNSTNHDNIYRLLSKIYPSAIRFFVYKDTYQDTKAEFTILQTPNKRQLQTLKAIMSEFALIEMDYKNRFRKLYDFYDFMNTFYLPDLAQQKAESETEKIFQDPTYYDPVAYRNRNYVPQLKMSQKAIQREREGMLKSAGGQKKKYYHASPKLFSPGDIISPLLDDGYRNYSISGNLVYMSSSPKPHYTVATKANRENWYVYEVQPTGKVDVGTCWDEFVTNKPCVVVKRIGNTRGISKAGKPKKGFKESKEWYQNMIQDIKEVIADPEKRREYMEDNAKDYRTPETPEDKLKRLKLEAQFLQPETSKALYKSSPFKGLGRKPKPRK